MKDDSLSDVQKMFEARTRGNKFGRFVDGQLREAVEELNQYKYEPDSVGKQEPDPLLAKHETALNVYAKQIWNDAIEAAAKLSDYPDTADKIRKLRKGARKQRQTALRVRGHSFETVELDDAGNVIEPIRCICGGMIVIHKPNCPFYCLIS